MYPACVAWTERWHPAPHVKQFTKASNTLKAEWQSATLTELVLFPMVPYLLWAVLYYAKVRGAGRHARGRQGVCRGRRMWGTCEVRVLAVSA